MLTPVLLSALAKVPALVLAAVLASVLVQAPALVSAQASVMMLMASVQTLVLVKRWRWCQPRRRL